MHLAAVEIAGSVSTVGSSLTFGPYTSVGNHEWLNTGATGIQEGHHAITPPLYVPEVKEPFTNGMVPFSPYAVLTTNGMIFFDMGFVADGDYMVSSLSGSVFIGGSARIFVKNTLDTLGIEIAPGARLELYNNAATGRLGGVRGVSNQTGCADRFIYFGLPSNTELTFNGDLLGCIYSPQADVTITGGGDDVRVLTGALVANTLRPHTSVDLHYDAALSNTGPTWENPSLQLSFIKEDTNGILRVSGAHGLSYILQYSENISGTNWHDFVDGSIGTSGSTDHLAPPTSAFRFYRAVLQ